MKHKSYKNLNLSKITLIVRAGPEAIIFLPLERGLKRSLLQNFKLENYRRRHYFRTHLYAILGRFGAIFPYFWTPMWIVEETIIKA